MKTLIILILLFSYTLQCRDYRSFCERMADAEHYSKGILVYADDKPDILLSIESKIYEEGNAKTLEFDLASFESYYFEEGSTNNKLWIDGERVANELYVKTFEDIPEDFIYSTGRTYMVLSNGVKIQMQDIKINADSSYDVFPVKHSLLENSPILDLAVYPIVKIEFELFYCRTNIRNLSKKIIVNKQNIIGTYTPYKPFTYREVIKCSLNSLGLNSLERQNLFNSSDLLGSEDCNKWDYEELNRRPYSLPLVCDPKFGPEYFEITISPTEEGVLFKFERPSTSISEEIVNVNLYLENGEKVTLLKPTIKIRDRYNNPIPHVKGLKYFKKEVSKIDKQMESLGNYEIVGMDYDVYTTYNNTGGGLTFKESIKPIFTRGTRRDLSDFRFFIACKIQKAKNLKRIK